LRNKQKQWIGVVGGGRMEWAKENECKAKNHRSKIAKRRKMEMEKESEREWQRDRGVKWKTHLYPEKNSCLGFPAFFCI